MPWLYVSVMKQATSNSVFSIRPMFHSPLEMAHGTGSCSLLSLPKFEKQEIEFFLWFWSKLAKLSHVQLSCQIGAYVTKPSWKRPNKPPQTGFVMVNSLTPPNKEWTQKPKHNQTSLHYRGSYQGGGHCNYPPISSN